MTLQTDDPMATQFISAQQPDANATLMAQPVKCPVCGADNSTLDIYCRDCGFMLAQTPAVEEEVEIEDTGRRLVSLDGLREFSLHSGENTVGREDSDVLLSDSSVSRAHAVVIVVEGGVKVKDIGSTNGTKASGTRLGANEERALRSGDEVVFGTVVLRYESDVEEADAVIVDEVDGQPEAAGEPAVAMVPARLASTDGSMVFELKAGLNKIGRRVDINDIALPDPFSSGSHAEITEDGGIYRFVDLGSTNGSLVNGVKMAGGDVRTLISGDELTLGKTTLRFEVIDND